MTATLSLRLRLALLIAVLIATVVGTFAWVAYSQIVDTLEQAGGARAQAAANQIADLLERPIAQAVSDLGRLAATPAIRALADHPGPETEKAARTLLAPFASNGPRRIEIWNTTGVRLLEISVPSSVRPGETPHSLPPAPAPAGEGVTPLQTDDAKPITDIVVSIPAAAASPDGSATAPRAGYLLLRSMLSLNPPGIVGRLIGGGALAKLGDVRGGAWTDFAIITDAPPVDLHQQGINEYTTAAGERRLGALQPVKGSQLIVWVDFPRDSIVAPANALLQRMILAALAFVVVGAGLGWLLSRSVTQPLVELSQAATRIAEGDYSRRVAISRGDEIGSVAVTFNAMAAKVEEAYRRLKQNHDQTQFAMAAGRMGVWQINLPTGEVIWSDTMPPVFGLTKAQAPKTREEFLGLIHPDDQGKLRDGMFLAAANREDYREEFRAIWPDGSIHWVDSRARIAFDTHGTPVACLGVAIDVTEQRHLEEQLMQAQKMEAVGQLAGGIAHDFNNLLTAILGFGNLIKSRFPANDLTRMDIDEVLKAGESASTLTRQLLAFSRRQVMRPRVVSVNEVVRHTEKMLRRLIPANIQLTTTLQADADTVNVDAAQLEQVLVNLVVNARDAMPDGGLMTLETASADLDSGYANGHAGVTPGRYVRITVSDTGTGMDPETQRRLFEPFFTTKPHGVGTGLGLATVYGIVKQSGGHIYVYSEIGRGSAFKIYLPFTGAASAEQVESASESSLGAGSETILLVEDNEAARNLAHRVLVDAGYRVLVANSGEDALALLASQPEPIDVILTDVIMQGMTGPELVTRLATQLPDVKVIFASGYSDEAISRHGVLEPGTLFIQKPYTPVSLTRKVREALS